MKTNNDSVVLAGGCFWCTEATLKMLRGVKSVTPGYSGGTTSNPTYEEVCTGETGHAEVVQVEYDSKLVSFEKILDIFFTAHDPTQLNRQGNDVGTQYRSAIFCAMAEQKKAAQAYIERLQKEYSKPIVTEVKMLDKFYPAEEYHKNYFEKNPNEGYCQFVIRPKIEKVKHKLAYETL